MNVLRIFLITLFFVIIPGVLAYFIYDSFDKDKSDVYKYGFIGGAILSIIIGIVVIFATRPKETPRKQEQFDTGETPRKQEQFDTGETPRKQEQFDTGETPRKQDALDEIDKFGASQEAIDALWEKEGKGKFSTKEEFIQALADQVRPINQYNQQLHDQADELDRQAQQIRDIDEINKFGASQEAIDALWEKEGKREFSTKREFIQALADQVRPINQYNQQLHDQADELERQAQQIRKYGKFVE